MKKIGLLLLSTILAGCGGGGSSSTTGGTPTTVPVSPAVTQNFQVTATPTYAPASEEYGYFVAVNAFRTGQGLGPLNQNVAYDKAAWGSTPDNGIRLRNLC